MTPASQSCTRQKCQERPEMPSPANLIFLNFSGIFWVFLQKCQDAGKISPCSEKSNLVDFSATAAFLAVESRDLPGERLPTWEDTDFVWEHPDAGRPSSLHFASPFAVLTIPESAIRASHGAIFENIFQIWRIFPDLGPLARQAFFFVSSRRRIVEIRQRGE
ncbi:MAG: hypothetical protein ACM3U2_19960 [Deltaproteobacteria bacterium]